jgi:flavin-dependent dehydrogenase
MLQSLEPAEEVGGELVPSPATAGLLVDDDGDAWVLTRRPLDARVARRLVRRADVVIIGDGAGDVLRRVGTAAEDREAAWAEVEDRLGREDLPGYEAFRGESDDGRKLLYLEQSC